MADQDESRGGGASGGGGGAIGPQHFEGSIEDIDRQLGALDQESDSDSESLEELDACKNVEVVSRAGENDEAGSGRPLDVTVCHKICLFCKKPFQRKCKKDSKLLLDMSNTSPRRKPDTRRRRDYEGFGGDKKKSGGKFHEPSLTRSLVFDPEAEQDDRCEQRERNTVVHFDERNLAQGGSSDESPTSLPAGSGGHQQFQRPL